MKDGRPFSRNVCCLFCGMEQMRIFATFRTKQFFEDCGAGGKGRGRRGLWGQTVREYIGRVPCFLVSSFFAPPSSTPTACKGRLYLLLRKKKVYGSAGILEQSMETLFSLSKCTALRNFDPFRAKMAVLRKVELRGITTFYRVITTAVSTLFRGSHS
jgi:hypothetical protein